MPLIHRRIAAARRAAVVLTATAAAGLLTAAPARGADGEVARALRRQQLFLTVPQTRTVQRRIHVRADGAWGSDTVDAMRRYQRRRHLAVTGAANVESLRAMRLRIADRFEAQLWAARAAARSTRTRTAASALGAAAVRWSYSTLGTPYRTGGHTTDGFDCSGLIQWAFRHAGRELPRTSFAMYQRGWPVTKGALRPGDLVFFDAAGPGASHVAIVVTATSAISATTSSGVAVHDIAHGYWAAHYIGARRLAAD